MTYKKRFLNKSGVSSPISGANSNQGSWNGAQDGTSQGGWNNQEFGYKNYGSRLPEVYTGHPNRIERYNQYEMMDVDAEVNACLDIISEFSTQKNEHNKTPFSLEFKEDPTQHEVELLKKQLQQWCKLNEFDSRIFKIFRNSIKYGDQVFVRDPENFKLYWVDMTKIIKVIVNESEGKKPEQYVIKDININLQNLTVAQKTNTDFAANPATGLGGTGGGGGGGGYTVPSMPYNTTGSRFTLGQSESAIDAKHIVHLSLTEGLDRFWPFGQSVLENIFKVYKQKELLEDAVLIYRVQRAPERRMFKIDVGNMPSHMAMAFVERIKNEIHQKRIPSYNGAGSVVDASYNPLCLDLDTKIPLLDGRTLSLSTIIEEFEQGKENWAYSCDPVTGEVMPGVINWAGITRRDTAVIKLTFDNGNTLICTPDHKIPVFGKGFVEAKDLTSMDSLIAFNTKNEKISNKGNDYQKVWDHLTKKWVWTHRLVGKFFRNRKKHQEFNYLPEHAVKARNVIHHKDSNRFNNSPANLTYMNKTDHILYHAAQKKEFWEIMSEEYRNQMTDKISTTLKTRWSMLSEEERNVALWTIRTAQKQAVWNRKNIPETAKKYAESMREARKNYFERSPAGLAQTKLNCEARVKIKNQPLNLTFDMLQIVSDIVKSGNTNKNDALLACDTNQRLLSLVKSSNNKPLEYSNAQCKIDFTKFGYSKMNRLLKHFGYKNWKTFVNEIDNFNHRVVKIEKITNKDTGTITIDGLHRWHNHHTFAIDSGIFVKNSMNEDYFFPVTADGRGSSVEMLPGGQNLGEIDDLRYFNNRLARGLRVPSSYLPTGPDDNTTPLSDGRVGTAMIQEFRFNQYCERLQSYLCHKLDEEFKLFLRWRGFSIDSGIFSLVFNPPQNFAAYRQSELDTARIGSFTSMEQYPYISKRFALERFLGLTEEEISKNEKLWREEQDKEQDVDPLGSDLRSVGVSVGDIESDEQLGQELENPPEEGAEGPEVAGPVTSATSQAAVPGGAPGQI